MKNMQKVCLLASVVSAFAAQVIFASQISSEVASETAAADNERERERESNSHAICASGF